jgi:hypothetical protein
MSKGNTFENDFLKLILWGTAIANIADNAASAPLTQLHLALHTADPGEGGDQTTNEVTYTGYARKALNRDNTGFSITDNVATLAADQVFGTCTAGPQTTTHFSLGTASSGAGKILWKGPITPNIAILIGGSPTLKAATNINED